MVQYEMWFTNEYIEEILDDIAPIMKVHHKQQDIDAAMQERDYNSLKNLLILKKYDPVEFSSTVQCNWKTVTMNYIAWQNYDFKEEMKDEEKQTLLGEIKNILKHNDTWYFVF